MTARSWAIFAALLAAAALVFWFEVASGSPQAVWECQLVRLCP